jgi:hypothetical protein
VLTVSNVARETAVHRTAVEGYLDVLEDLLVALRLPVFTKRASRATVAHPKFYFFDTGVFRALRPTGPLDRPAEVDGRALRVGSVLLAHPHRPRGGLRGLWPLQLLRDRSEERR